MTTKRTAAAAVPSSPRLHAWAYLGAWELAIDIIRTFPDLLPQLNAVAANGNGAHPTIPTPTGETVRRFFLDESNGNGTGRVARDGTRRGSKPGTKRGPYKKRSVMTPEQREAMAEKMRRQWRKARREGRASLAKSVAIQKAANAAASATKKAKRAAAENA